MPNTSDIPDFASIAGLVADPTRSRMLLALMGGRAHTATELAIEGGITPSTASSHLARLRAGGLVTIAKQGRHRYFRLSAPEVATAIEGLMQIAPHGTLAHHRPGPRDERLRRARVCYDHLAGEAGVRLLEQLRRAGFV
jgi:DNA-binding transcriptional ArsR family regulator